VNFYVGVTDKIWFEHHKANQVDEVNFWLPGGNINFHALSEGELFLFKLHKRNSGKIVGGGYFVRFSFLPIFLAWEAFGEKNGVSSLQDLESIIRHYREKNKRPLDNPQIGCIILTEPFFFKEDDWIDIPKDWGNGIVQGKRYSSDTSIGRQLLEEVKERQGYVIGEKMLFEHTDIRYAFINTKRRIGQGAFRIVVTEAYNRKCAFSGEKTLPILEAAHIKPYARDGQHALDNGVLLRSDLHILFDKGYITIDDGYRIEVSKRLNSDYGNGKMYYSMHGQNLVVLPQDVGGRPSLDNLQWHNENIYFG
jgi:putative restriction endonuclease